MTRLLTASDALAIEATARVLQPNIDAATLFVAGAGERVLVVGEPPAFCRLLNYQITNPQQLDLFPPDLATLLRASRGNCVQVTHMGPFSASDKKVTANLLPHLASALKGLTTRFPALATLPVWACFDGVPLADARKLVGQMRLVFPGAGFQDNYIWWTLAAARDAVAGSAVDV